MAVSDIAALDAILWALLAGDPALTALCPDGVHWNVAPQGAESFVLVTRPATIDRALALDGDGWERFTYAVTAVMKTPGAVPVGDAALRIHELLHRQWLDLAPAGYTLMLLSRAGPIRYSEVDAANTSILWQHEGGQYEIQVCPAN